MVCVPRSNSSQGSSSGIRILLVEDNDVSRQLMSDFLTHCGHEVCSLAEATAFMAVMETFQPEIVLLDLKLPKVDGYTVLQTLQQAPEWQKVPVIVVSAFAFRTDQQRALSLGARRYLVKPVKLTDLTAAIYEEMRLCA